MSHDHGVAPVGQAFAWLAFGLIVIAVAVGLIGGACWAIPKYDVYQQTLKGEAEFKRAEQNRRITIEEARAELDAAELLREADIIRARGIADANEIIGQSITTPYLQWLWIEGLHNENSEVIYVPTEAGLPILEAGLRGGAKLVEGP